MALDTPQDILKSNGIDISLDVRFEKVVSELISDKKISASFMMELKTKIDDFNKKYGNAEWPDRREAMRKLTEEIGIWLNTAMLRMKSNSKLLDNLMTTFTEVKGTMWSLDLSLLLKSKWGSALGAGSLNPNNTQAIKAAV